MYSIQLPDSIITIGDNAFNKCSELKSVKFPKNIEVMERGMFANDIRLEIVILGDKLTTIEDDCFCIVQV